MALPAIFCAVIFLHAFASGFGAEERPNIIFIVADDLGWNDVSFHGYNEIPTPNIDRLAQSGVILNSHYAQALCSPSRASLMTGKYPIRLGMQNGVLTPGTAQSLPLNEKLLPEYLRDAGYSTHMYGKWHLGYAENRMLPTSRGFDSFFGYLNAWVDYYTSNLIWDFNPAYGGLDLWDNLEFVGRNYTGQYLTELLTAKANERIKNHNFNQKPLFMYIAHLAAHFANTEDPMQAPDRYTNRFDHIAHSGRKTTAGMIAALDDSLGQIVDALQERNALHNTIIVFTADNGASGPEKLIHTTPPFTYGTNWPLRGTKMTQWEGGVRTSAFVWSDLIKGPGRVSNEIFHISDWLPTLISLAGGQAPGEIDGHNIWTSIANGYPSPRQEVLIQADSVNQEYAIRWHQFKLILGGWTATGSIPDGWYPPVGGVNASFERDTPSRLHCPHRDSDIPCHVRDSPCLFDVETDPCEHNNIVSYFPDIEKLLLDKLAVYNASAVLSGPWRPDPRAATALHDGIMAPWL
ncbi:arylsulfatase B-like [Paramacrobiotus metropolitanus]|uniref:arylsulfatase B-like n=1 Tax=Paramacrobiotus metropolitanus TaxID=2943436 RepID=UPI002445C6DA|nr:arylsulfatase B-like [Paramacrobiotus metropolitanus]